MVEEFLGKPEEQTTASELSKVDWIGKFQQENKEGSQEHAQQVAPGFFRGKGIAPEPAATNDPPPVFGKNKPPKGADNQPAAPPTQKKDWRAHPFTEPPAPGFFRKPEVPPNQRRDGFDAQPPPDPVVRNPAGRPNRPGQMPDGESLKAEVERLKPLVEINLDPASGFWGNAVAGGFGAYAGGGPLARGLDRVSKTWLANKEPGGYLQRPFDWLAEQHQRHLGLTDNMQPARQLTDKLNEARLSIIRSTREPGLGLPPGESLEYAAGRVQREALQRNFDSVSAAEREIVGRHAFFTGQQIPEQLRFSASPADQALRLRVFEAKENWERVKTELAAGGYNVDEFNRLNEQNRLHQAHLNPIVEKVRQTGQPIQDLFERAAEAGVSPDELALKRKYEFLRDYMQDSTKKPADYRVTLTAVEQELLKDSKQLRAFMDNLESQGKSALEKYTKAGEAALTEQQLMDLKRFKFFNEFERNPLADGRGLLRPDEIGTVTANAEVRSRLVQMEPLAVRSLDLMPLEKAYRAARNEMEAVVKQLESQAKPLYEKLNKPVEQLLTQSEKNLIARYEFMRTGAVGQPPAGVVLQKNELELIKKREVLQERLALLDPKQAPEVVALQAERNIIARSMAERARDLRPQLGNIAERIGANPTPIQLNSALTAEELNLYNKVEYFKNPLKNQLPDMASWSEEERVLARRLAQIESNLGKLKPTEATAARTLFPQFVNGRMVADSHLSNFAKGMATIAAADFVSDRLDNAIFGKSVWGSHRSKTTPYITAITPWVGMAVPGGWLKKGGAVVGLNMLGHSIQHALPLERADSKWSKILRPTGFDSFALGVGVAIPLRGETLPKRLAVMGGTWALGKAAQYAFDGPNPRQVRDRAWESLSEDKVQRTASTMERTIDKMKELDKHQLKGDARKEMSLLEYYLVDWQSRDHSTDPNTQEKDPLNGLRGHIMFLTAAGEGRLEHGTRVSAKGQGSSDDMLKRTWNIVKASVVGQEDRQYDYIVAGKDYDLGGQALQYLYSASKDVIKAKAATQENLNKEIRGQKVTQAEIEGLDQVGQRINCSMEKIYGKHDMRALMTELQEYTIKLNQKITGKLRDDVKATINNPGTDDPRFKAKFLRDLALIDLAWAANKMGENGAGNGRDGMSAESLIGEAKFALAEARRIDPDQKKEDLQQLEQIERELESRYPGKIKAQWADKVFNPLQLPR